MTVVAETIREQIGLGTFMRIGARRLRDEGTALSFEFTGTTEGGARRVLVGKVTLTPADLYRVEVFRSRVIAGVRVTTDRIAEHDDVSFDVLPRLLQQEAGEAGSLGLRPTWW